MPLPLHAHALFHSSDLDEARERVSAIFCPHRLDSGTAGFDARHHHLRGRDISLNYIEYGADTRIVPGQLDGFYLLQMPLSGGARIRNGRQDYVTGPGQAAVLNPHLPTAMEWGAGTRQILIQIRREAMQRHLDAQLQGDSAAPLTFLGPVDLTAAPGAALRRLILWLVAETDAGAPPLGSGLMAEQIERTVLAGLLEAADHDHRGRLSRSRAAPRPRHLRLAESFIEAHLDQPITLEAVADAAGISPRGLQLAFRQHRDATPLGFWRDARLARAHADLSRGSAEDSVTAIALKWGFGHFGRFSEIYRKRYGLSPRDTLRAAQLG